MARENSFVSKAPDLSTTSTFAVLLYPEMTYPLGKIWQPRWFALIRQEYPDQPVYLCGESFWGLSGPAGDCPRARYRQPFGAD